MAETSDITYVEYKDEAQIEIVKNIMTTYLSEPYPVYTYRYFLTTWPDLCILCMKGTTCIGCIVSKVSPQKVTGMLKGYIAMLAVEKEYRRLGIGRKLVELTLEKMKASGVGECVLETEIVNEAALRLYESIYNVKNRLWIYKR